MEVEFDVKMDAGILYDYMLHHTYSSFAGLMGTAAGALLLVIFYSDRKIIYLQASSRLLTSPGRSFCVPDSRC